MDALTDSRETV